MYHKATQCTKGTKKNFEAAFEGFADELEDDGSDDNESDLMDADSFADGIGETANEDDDVDDVDDGQSKMTEEEISMLEESVKPVQLVLFKVGLLSATSLVMLNKFCSFKRPHTQSRTQQHSFFT
jgi:hypothetical protein